jgi:hypothetical protein
VAGCGGGRISILIILVLISVLHRQKWMDEEREGGRSLLILLQFPTNPNKSRHQQQISFSSQQQYGINSKIIIITARERERVQSLQGSSSSLEGGRRDACTNNRPK